jgi:hypothetical protein
MFAVLRTAVADIYVAVVCLFVLLPLAILHLYAFLYGLLHSWVMRRVASEDGNVAIEPDNIKARPQSPRCG